MSGAVSVKGNANATMSFSKFDELTGADRKYNKGTLVLKNSGKVKTLSCVNHHKIAFNLTKVSHQQVKDLRSEFSAAVREELESIGLKLAKKNLERYDEIMAKFKAIGEEFDKKILMPSWDNPPELSRADIRVIVSDVKKLKHVTVDSLLQLGADDLSRLASNRNSAADAASIRSGSVLVARRDACLDQLRMNIGKCDANQLESVAGAIVKAMVPKVDDLLGFIAKTTRIQDRLKLFFEPEDQLLDIKNTVKDIELKLELWDLDEKGKISGPLTRKIAAFEKITKTSDPKADARQTILYAISCLMTELNNQLTAAAEKVNTAFKKCGIKTLSASMSVDQFFVTAKYESDLGALKADVCKLARALGALPPDKDTDQNGLGEEINLKGRKLDQDEEAQNFRAAFGGKNDEKRIIHNMRNVLAEMSTIMHIKRETVVWTMDNVKTTAGDIKPFESMTDQSRKVSRKDYAAKILDSLKTMFDSGPKALEARRQLLGRICDDMFKEFDYLIDNDMKAKRKIFALVMRAQGYEVVKEVGDEDFMELYDEYGKNHVDYHKRTIEGMVNNWKAHILAKVKPDDNLAAMVNQVKEALGICPNGLDVVLDGKVLQEKRQVIDAIGNLAKTVSDKAWNGEWDEAVRQHLQLGDAA